MSEVVLNEVQAWVSIFSDLGTIGFLAVFLFLFVKGEIISRNTVNIIIEQVTTKILDHIDGLKSPLPPARDKRRNTSDRL